MLLNACTTIDHKTGPKVCNPGFLFSDEKLGKYGIVETIVVSIPPTHSQRIHTHSVVIVLHDGERAIDSCGK